MILRQTVGILEASMEI